MVPLDFARRRLRIGVTTPLNSAGETSLVDEIFVGLLAYPGDSRNSMTLSPRREKRTLKGRQKVG